MKRFYMWIMNRIKADPMYILCFECAYYYDIRELDQLTKDKSYPFVLAKKCSRWYHLFFCQYGNRFMLLETYSCANFKCKKKQWSGDKGEVFDPGVDREFAEALTEAVKLYSSSAIRLFADIISNGIVGPTVASEMLCILGDIDDAATHDDRFALLVACLSNKSSRIREGAILGLSRLGDLRAVHHLKAAYENEPYEFLQQYISQVMDVLATCVCEEI